MKNKVLGLALVVLTGCAVQTPAVNEEDIAFAKSILPTNKALTSYLERYSNGKDHRAFALSETGKWAWVRDRISTKTAIKNALSACQSNNKKHEDSFPCKVVNIDGQWVSKTANN